MLAGRLPACLLPGRPPRRRPAPRLMRRAEPGERRNAPPTATAREEDRRTGRLGRRAGERAGSVWPGMAERGWCGDGAAARYGMAQHGAELSKQLGATGGERATAGRGEARGRRTDSAQRRATPTAARSDYSDYHQIGCSS